MLVDGGSYENFISKEDVDKLQLKTEKHPSPYKLSWCKKGNEVIVHRSCLVSFSIGGVYFDNVMCDLVPEMDACHILFDRPWQYDKRTVHDDTITRIHFGRTKRNLYLSLCVSEFHSN